MGRRRTRARALAATQSLRNVVLLAILFAGVPGWSLTDQQVRHQRNRVGDAGFSLKKTLISKVDSCPDYDEDRTVHGSLLRSFQDVLQLSELFGPPAAPPKTKVAYFKTHKTGSSTMHAITVNLANKFGLLPVSSVVDKGSHLGLQLGCPSQTCLPELAGKFDVEFRHLTSTPNFRAKSPHATIDACFSVPDFFDHVVTSLECLIDKPAIITSFRDPVEQFVSCFTYYSYHGCDEAKKKLKGKVCSDIALMQARLGFVGSLADHMTHGKARPPTFNVASRDFGLGSPKDVDAFVDKYLASDKLHVVVLERLFESLVALRRDQNWSFRDILHVRTNSVENKLQLNLTVDDPDELARLKLQIRNNTHQDQMLYRAAVAQLDRRVARHTAGPNSTFAMEVASLQRAVSSLTRLCACRPFLVSTSTKEQRALFDLPGFCQSFGASETTRERMLVSSSKVAEFSNSVLEGLSPEVADRLSHAGSTRHSANGSQATPVHSPPTVPKLTQQQRLPGGLRQVRPGEPLPEVVSNVLWQLEVDDTAEGERGQEAGLSPNSMKLLHQAAASLRAIGWNLTTTPEQAPQPARSAKSDPRG